MYDGHPLETETYIGGKVGVLYFQRLLLKQWYINTTRERLLALQLAKLKCFYPSLPTHAQFVTPNPQVEALESGVFRADLPVKFKCKAAAYQVRRDACCCLSRCSQQTPRLATAHALFYSLLCSAASHTHPHTSFQQQLIDNLD